MKKLRVVVSLPNDNQYRHEQGLAAKSVGNRLGVDLQIMTANDDAITQSQQLLKIVQSQPESRPDAILVEPETGTGLRRVAEAAVAAGVGWVTSDGDIGSIRQLRKISRVPIFAVTQGQLEIGQLQGQQVTAILPAGGRVLYIQGPSMSSVSRQRREGMERTTPSNAQIIALRSKWSEDSACDAVSSWLRLPVVRAANIDLIVGQTHELALGARKAFQGLQDAEQRAAWHGLPFIGIGISRHVEPLVDQGILSAAVITSVTMGLALEMLVLALEARVQPAECTVVEISSYPKLEGLRRLKKTS